MGVLTIAAALLAAPTLWLIWKRPQRGLLLLAALVPFNGLLLITANGEQFTGWKEGLVLLTLLFAVISPYRQVFRPTPPPFWPLVAAFVVVGSASALLTYGTSGIFAIKITFFYIILLAIMSFAPLTVSDRDHLVTILMVTGTITAVWGIAQQFIGGARLVELGYEYNDSVRFSGGLMRSFSTFNQPFPFALFLMFVLLMGVTAFLFDTGRLRNRLFMAASPLLLAGIGLSVVRAAMLGLAVGVLWLAYQQFRKLFYLIGAVALAAAATLALAPASLIAPILSSSSLGERGSGWTTIVDQATRSPFGQGLGTTGAAGERRFVESLPPGIDLEAISIGGAQIEGVPYQPDNYYIKMLIELGPLGMWFIVVFLLGAIVSTLRTSRRLHGTDAAFALGTSASIAAAAAAAVVSTYFEIFPMDVYFWLSIGAVACARTPAPRPRLRSDSERSRSAPEAAESKPTHVRPSVR